jgi:flagellar protein FliS
MTQNTLIKNYKKDAVLSAPPGKLMLMLYDGALQNLNHSLRALEKGDRPSFGLYLRKGQAIIAELLNTLDHKVAGDIPRNLEKLYLFVIDRLTQSNLERNSAGVEDSIRILKTLKEGWDDAVSQTAN